MRQAERALRWRPASRGRRSHRALHSAACALELGLQLQKRGIRTVDRAGGLRAPRGLTPLVTRTAAPLAREAPDEDEPRDAGESAAEPQSEPSCALRRFVYTSARQDLGAVRGSSGNDGDEMSLVLRTVAPRVAVPSLRAT